MQYLSQPCIAVSHDSHAVQKPDDSEKLSIGHIQHILPNQLLHYRNYIRMVFGDV